MKRLLSLMASFGALAALLMASVPGVASAAAKPTASTPELVGYDVSYPQCGKRLPTDHYFAVVGINGGNASTANACLADQLVWANKARSGSTQPKVQLYVNTANPGQVINQVTTWPTDAADSTGTAPANPYGAGCNGGNDLACSWLYGWNRSIYTEDVFKKAATAKGLNANTAAYVWWLDVETMNTWQTGSAEALARNAAALEGFAAYYQAKQATVGLYSTAVQWGEIAGSTLRAGSNLNGLGNWRPSGASLANAKSNCKVAPLTTGGRIVLTQYVIKNLDHNHACV